MSGVTAPQSKLVLNAFAAYFENSLTTADAVSWKMYDGEMSDTNRLQVVEQVVPNYVVTQTDNGVADLSGGPQASVFGGELFTVNKSFGTSMGWGDFEAIQTMGDARESNALKSAARNLAEQIDYYVLQVATLASNNWTGTVTANVADQNDVVSAYTRLKEEGVEDGDMRYIMNWTDRQLLGDQVINLPGPDGFPTDTYKEGFNSKVNGVPAMFTQQLPTLTVGTRAASGAAQVNGAAENVNYVDVANQTSTNGWYMTQELDIKNLTNGHTIKAGEVFTIADVYAYDNRKQALVSPARLQQFTVVTGTTLSGTTGTIRIFPAIIVPETGTGDNYDINTAHATVGSIPADSAAITWLGTASTTLAPRLLIQKQAVVCNTQQLRLPVTGVGMRRKLEKIPLSVRMWANSDWGTGFYGVRFDLMLNANIRDRRRVCRFNGS